MCLQGKLDESSHRIPSSDKVTNKTQTNTTRFIHLPAHHSKIIENEPPSAICIINCNISWMLRERHGGKKQTRSEYFWPSFKNSLSLSLSLELSPNNHQEVDTKQAPPREEIPQHWTIIWAFQKERLLLQGGKERKEWRNEEMHTGSAWKNPCRKICSK